jgi:hypothetical protein
MTTGAPPVAIANPNPLRDILRQIRGVSLTVKLFTLALLAIYLPALAEASRVWLKDDKQAHGVFILPLVAFLLWLLRDDLRKVGEARPTVWGLVILGIGLFVQAGSHILGLQAIPLASVVVVLWGTILLLHGRRSGALFGSRSCFCCSRSRSRMRSRSRQAPMSRPRARILPPRP